MRSRDLSRSDRQQTGGAALPASNGQMSERRDRWRLCQILRFLIDSPDSESVSCPADDLKLKADGCSRFNVELWLVISPTDDNARIRKSLSLGIPGPRCLFHTGIVKLLHFSWRGAEGAWLQQDLHHLPPDMWQVSLACVWPVMRKAWK